MIELHRPVASPAADEIAATLRELVVAHREVEDDTLDGPVIVDGSTSLSETDAIAAFLEQLRRDVTAWNAFQSDACYIADDGTVC